MRGGVLQCFIGQCGVQVGHAVWELQCTENGISRDGSPKDTSLSASNDLIETVFAESHSGRYVPRCAIVDTEPSVIDEIRTGAYRNLFNSSQLVSGCEDSASNFARGYYQNGRRVLRPTMNVIRQLTESCDSLHAFILHRALGGGTGSGFTTALLEAVKDEYAKQSCIEMSIFPSESMTNSTVEAYNSLLGCCVPIRLVDLSVLCDNKALLNNCMGIEWMRKTTMTHLNQILAQVLSGLLSPLQFQTQLPLDITSIQTNLVPYPEAHFVTGSLAPLKSIQSGERDAVSCSSITRQVFEPENQLLTCPQHHQPTYLACCLLYRGAISPKQVNTAIMKTKAAGKLSWVDWCPTGFKVSISNQPMACISGIQSIAAPFSLLMLHNSTTLLPSLRRVLREFQHLYSRRAFIHWFTREGMDEAEFTEAMETLTQLQSQYSQTSLVDAFEKSSNNRSPYLYSDGECKDVFSGHSTQSAAWTNKTNPVGIYSRGMHITSSPGDTDTGYKYSQFSTPLWNHHIVQSRKASGQLTPAALETNCSELSFCETRNSSTAESNYSPEPEHVGYVDLRSNRFLEFQCNKKQHHVEEPSICYVTV